MSPTLAQQQSSRGEIMKKSFYTTLRPCYIYLLVLDPDDEEPYFFVGKSFSNAISKVVSRHINGGYALTKNVFSREERPKLYVLQDLCITGAEAYRYVVAYTKYFMTNQLGECLNYDGTMWQAEGLKQDTEIIYQAISQEPLEDLLNRTYVTRAVDADRKNTSEMMQGVKRIVQLNIAVSEADKDLFRTYCRHLGIGQREAFGLLLDHVTNDKTGRYENVIRNKEAIINKQAQEIGKLEHKLAIANGEALPKKELWASAMVPFMIVGIKQYVQLLFPPRETVNPIKSRPYKGFMKNIPLNEEYDYPEKEGFYIIKLQAVLWGNNKSCFYVGVSLDGKHYRFRYYARDWFMGIPPRGSGYEESDSLWLMGCKKAIDGAMDLVASLPLLMVQPNKSKDKELTETECLRKPSLADRITDVVGRKPV